MKAPQYRVRTGLRFAAVAPSLVLTIGGIAVFVVGVQLFSRSILVALVATAVGLVGTVVGTLFLRVLWTGRGPAAVEEYGLSDSEIAQHRSEARAHGRLVE